MCGICGFVGGWEPGLIRAMNAAQSHRGPDGSGLFEDPAAQVGLGHVRLAVLDLSDHAAQPMHTPDGRYVLTFNGEIYNFVELRERLEGLGHSFTSTGDTEVLLHGLEEFGARFLEMLNGMFALALWDRRGRELLLARDPLGVKPVYYAEPSPGTLLFASEIKALCAHPRLAREVDPVAVQQHLSFCHACGEHTALEAVKRLLPGTFLRWKASRRGYEIQRYWQPCYDQGALPKRDEAVLQTRRLVEDATCRQLVSDVPVALSLSGGLDSSLIAALAARRGHTHLGGYTISYASGDLGLDRCDDDAPYARLAAQKLGLPLEAFQLRPDVASLWPQLVYHLDEPIADPAAIACYLVSKMARANGVKVLLSGQGADELFCGYPRYRAMRMTRATAVLPAPARWLIAAGARRLPGAWEGKTGVALRRMRRLACAVSEDADRRFLAYCASTPHNDVAAILSPAWSQMLHAHHCQDDCLRHMHQRGLRATARYQDRDLEVYLPNHNLLYMDKMSMAVGLEARVPFLDMAVVEAVTRYPDAWKLDGRRTKAVLRDAAVGLVPSEILHRPKAGFGAPFRKWLRYDLAELWDDLTNEDAVRRRGWFDHAALQQARRRSQSGQADLYMLQWAVLTLELWARRFLDQNPSRPELPVLCSIERIPSVKDKNRQACDVKENVFS